MAGRRLTIALVLVGVLVPAGTATAYTSRAAGLLVAKPDVELVKRWFSASGTQLCGNDAPEWVSPATQYAFCFEPSSGHVDTDLTFKYSIIATPGTGDFKGMLVNDVTHKCFDVKGAHTDDKTPLQVWRCNNTVAQDFDLTDNGPMRVVGRCVDAGGGNNGSPVTIRPCDGTADQKWRLDGKRRIVNNASNRCVDLAQQSEADGTPMRLADCASRTSQQWLGSSGYSAVGHVLVPLLGKTELWCVIDRDDTSRPARHFACETSTANDIGTSSSPEPHWTVSGAPLPPAGADRVVAIGDSVTAGFGYCGIEGGANSDGITCGMNGTMENLWLDGITGHNSLSDCQPVDPPTAVNDRCSNNNDRGNPWDAGPWFNDNRSPTIAYPFAIAKSQRTTDQVSVEDWAMTGSTPENWDPTVTANRDHPNAGVFGPQLGKIKNSYVVMTAGANPLLSAYITVDIAGFQKVRGKCSSSTRILIRPGTEDAELWAAPVDADQHKNGEWGVLHCFDQVWSDNDQSNHLLNVYKALLQQNNRVLVVGYPTGCPWSFGDWQPAANLFEGPAKGYPCPDYKLKVWDGNGYVSQWDQARALVSRIDQRLSNLVEQARSDTGKRDNIRFALPDQDAWADHQAWSGSSWVFKNDTWVHPSVEGHQQLAKTVTSAMCSAWGHWCGNPPSWN